MASSTQESDDSRENPVTVGNVFRTVVTALAFFYLFVVALVLLDWFVNVPEASGLVAMLAGAVLASVVVYSTAIPWIGDSSG